MKLSSAGSTVRKFSTRSSLKRPFYQRRGVQTATSVLLFTGGATGVLLSNPPEPASPLQDDNIKGPVDLLSAEHLRNSTAHLHHLSALDLLRSWLTYTLCTSSTLVSAGPSVVKTLEQLRDNVPLVGPLTWYIFCGVSGVSKSSACDSLNCLRISS